MFRIFIGEVEYKGLIDATRKIYSREGILAPVYEGILEPGYEGILEPGCTGLLEPGY